MSKERIQQIINILDFKQILDILFFPIILFISLLSKLFINKNIWLIEENPNEACDNGYILFKYIISNRKDINVYYVINKKSNDYMKVKELGNVINHGSIKHWIYYLNASRVLVTQKYANPSPALFHILHKYNLIKIPRVFLRHGIAKDKIDMFNYNNTKFRLFICGAKKEYEYIKNNFDYPEGYVVYTGFARFDNLDISENTNNKYILVTPTWRKWIYKQEDFDRFIEKYYDLINNEKLIKMLEKSNIKLEIVLHKNMKKFNINKNIKSNNIRINHNENVDIQALINKAELLVTDFSSIFMDIAYRKRSIIYYQFDKKEFRKNQLKEGYFSYEKDGFGDIIDNLDDLIKKIKYYIENNFKIEKQYLSKMDKFFERKDNDNCKRIVEEVERIK